MSTTPSRPGRVVIIGAGPAGMAAALSLHQAGHDVTLLERYPQARPAGNILNLWPPPVKALGLLGVDIDDLGAPCYTEFRSVAGRVRVRVNLSDEVLTRYGGGFIGLLRPDLYERMLAALPPGVLQVNRSVQRIEQDETEVRLHMADGEVISADVLVGADGIDSLVRRPRSARSSNKPRRSSSAPATNPSRPWSAWTSPRMPGCESLPPARSA
jgi:2-polyprenyl-6-methoxyphenol hydroxylase-like FAD-dependent oxidoreductase